MFKTFISRSESGFISQVKNFITQANANKGALIILLGLDALKITALSDGVIVYEYVVGVSAVLENAGTSCTAFKRELLNGNPLLALSPLPIAPVLPATPTAKPAPGLEKQFRALIQDVVRSPKCTEAILEQLGIAASQEKKDLAGTVPDFKLGFASGGHPKLVWTKGNFSGIEIWKSKDGNTFTFLDKDMHPDFIDKTALPAAGTSEVWHYKIIYLIGDDQIGQWSVVQSIAVKG